MLPQRPRGNSPNRFAGVDALRNQNTGFAANHGFGLDLRFFSDAYLPADYGIIAHAHAAGKTRLGGNHNMLADRTVVCNVNQIVNLCAIADPCHTERSAINARVRADLHVVADFHSAHLREFLIVVARKRETETVCAQNTSGVEDRPCAYADASIDRNVRVQHTVFSNRNTVTDAAARGNDAARADFRRVADRHISANDAIRTNPRGPGNDRCGMNRSGWPRFLVKRSERTSKCSARFANPNQRPGRLGWKRFRNQKASGITRFCLLHGLLIRDECKVRHSGLLQRVCPRDEPAAVSIQHAAADLGDFGGFQRMHPSYLA